MLTGLIPLEIKLIKVFCALADTCQKDAIPLFENVVIVMIVFFLFISTHVQPIIPEGVIMIMIVLKNLSPRSK